MPQRARGLPNPEAYGDMGTLRAGEFLDFFRQFHKANKAGPHEDWRFGTPESGLYSWAVRKGMPEPGQRHLAVQQPLHRHSYGSWEGTIPRGYGAGTVESRDKGQVLITHAAPDEVHFTTAHERQASRYMLKKVTGKNWLLINTTKTEMPPYEKVHYTKVPAEKAEEVLSKIQPGSSVQAKIDGAASLTQLFKDHVEILSYRESKKGGPIVHSERVWGGRPRGEIPKDLQGSVLRGELYGVEDRSGKAIRPQALGGLLNSGIAKSVGDQRARGQSLRQLVFDVQQLGNKPVAASVPYVDRLRMAQDALRRLGPLTGDKLHTPEEAKTPEEALKLWQDVKGGKNPLTHEGLVLWPEHGVPSKIKTRSDYDVVLTGTFPGKGKRQSTLGGFTYGHEPGKTIGRVGTGFSAEFLKDVAKAPQDYIGRVARLQAQEQFESGALRAPSFIAMHEDKNAPSAVDQTGRQVHSLASSGSGVLPAGINKFSMALPVQMWQHYCGSWLQSSEQNNPIMRLLEKRAEAKTAFQAWLVGDQFVCSLAQHGSALHGYRPQGLPALRWSRNNGVSKLAGELCSFLGGHGRTTSRIHAGKEEERRPIRSRQLHLGDEKCAGAQQAKQLYADSGWRNTHGDRMVGIERNEYSHDTDKVAAWILGCGGISNVFVPRQEPVQLAPASKEAAMHDLINGTLEEAVEKLAQYAAGGREKRAIPDWLSAIGSNPAVSHALIGGALGAGVGGIGTALGNVDKEEREQRGILPSMLTGGLAGAGIGAGVGLARQGYKGLTEGQGAPRADAMIPGRFFDPEIGGYRQIDPETLKQNPDLAIQVRQLAAPENPIATGAKGVAGNLWNTATRVIPGVNPLLSRLGLTYGQGGTALDQYAPTSMKWLPTIAGLDALMHAPGINMGERTGWGRVRPEFAEGALGKKYLEKGFDVLGLGGTDASKKTNINPAIREAIELNTPKQFVQFGPRTVDPYIHAPTDPKVPGGAAEVLGASNLDPRPPGGSWKSWRDWKDWLGHYGRKARGLGHGSGADPVLEIHDPAMFPAMDPKKVLTREMAHKMKLRGWEAYEHPTLNRTPFVGTHRTAPMRWRVGGRALAYLGLPAIEYALRAHGEQNAAQSKIQELLAQHTKTVE